MTLSIANHDASLPVAYRLYLPKEWAMRSKPGGVPDEISFKTKPEIALALSACEAGLPRGAVLMDAGYGVHTDLRTRTHGIGLELCRRHPVTHDRMAPGTGPRPPKKWSGHGRPPKLLRRDDKHQTGLGQGACASLPKRAWRTITWREATGYKRLPVRPCARSCRASGLLARRQSAEGVAVD